MTDRNETEQQALRRLQARHEARLREAQGYRDLRLSFIYLVSWLVTTLVLVIILALLVGCGVTPARAVPEGVASSVMCDMEYEGSIGWVAICSDGSRTVVEPAYQWSADDGTCYHVYEDASREATAYADCFPRAP